MTTVSRVSQVSHTGVAGTGDWDHRLNRLLEDLQETVIPSDSKLGNANEYREFRMTQRTQVNDEPAQQVDEKWVEIGTRGGGTLSIPDAGSNNFGSNSGGTTTRFGEKSVAFSDDLMSSSSTRFDSSSSSSRREPQVEYLAPANSTTIVRSGPSSPSGYTTSTSPKVERKEFYAKASYTTLIKGGPELVPQLQPDGNHAERMLEDLIPSDFRTPTALQSSRTSSESKRTYMSESNTGIRRDDPPMGQPLYASTPISKTTRDTREYNRELITDRTRSVTPPPKQAEALKTPPMIRKILQSSQQQSSTSCSSSYHQQQKTTSSTTSSSGRPPVGGVPLPIIQQSPSYTHSHPPQRENIPAYDDPPERPAARYYTSTTTTEHRNEREMSPVKRFPSPHPPRGGDGEPPKRLDDLMASFGDTSYTETSTTRYTSGDSSGAHKSIPYGPGSQPVQALRQVRIDDNIQQRDFDDDAELIHRKNAKKSEVDLTRPVAGPPVYFPPGQIFQKTEEEALMTAQEGGKGKGKMKMEREYKAKEKMKSKHSEKGGGAAVPVPVCLPVCCAAPCVIM